MPRLIYYLPGAGGRLDAGLGRALLARDYDVVGRESAGAFQRLKFEDRIRLVADDLRTNFWRDDALIVANSIGAYLFLHALSQLPLYPGKALLLSPIVGAASAPNGGPHFVPPYTTRLWELAQAGNIEAPKCCEIHVGSEDWQSNPAAVIRLGGLLRVPVNIVSGGGHLLDKGYVSEILDRWLG